MSDRMWEQQLLRDAFGKRVALVMVCPRGTSKIEFEGGWDGPCMAEFTFEPNGEKLARHFDRVSDARLWVYDINLASPFL